MNGMTKRCVSFAQGNKDPFQRVNYAFGLVLGVNEFVDEQCYFLEKEYQHNRALHGCGTVTGLHVTAAENGDDIEIRVAPGIGIDQYGRVFVVRNTQCASLLTWLDDQSLGAGEQSIYVVARYAECESDLVPIAGQPCSSSEQLSAPSRLRDIFEIELVTEPPPHAAHDAVINLAEFLSRLRRDPAAPDLAGLATADELAAIIGPDFITQPPVDFRAHVNQVIEDLTGVAGALLLGVPPAAVDGLLDRIFTYWVTQVRPTLTPDLIDPDTPANSEAEPPPAEVLLAQVNFVIPDQGPIDFDGITVDNAVRPYLLHTQLIQELFQVPDLAGGGQAAPAKPVRSFATVEDVSTRLLSLWVHIGHNIDLAPNQNFFLIRIGADGAQNSLNFTLQEDANRHNDVGRYYRLQTFVNLNNDDFLLLSFNAAQIQVSTPNGSQRLTDFINNAAFTYANFNPSEGLLSAFHIVERAETISPEQIREIVRELIPAPQPTIPFVTITPLTTREGQVDILNAYELWFHLDGILEQNDGGIDGLNGENVFLFSEIGPGAMSRLQIELRQIRPNVWQAIPARIQRQNIFFARIAFSLEAGIELRAFNPASGSVDSFGSLREYIDKIPYQLEGHLIRSDNFGEVLTVYVRQQGSATGAE